MALESLTLDQLRVLVTVANEGSFSAAARKLRRVQSAVSHAMKSLESELGIEVWDRATRVPQLTDGGRVVLAHARRVLGETDELARVTASLAAGLEASVSLCVDAVFPVRALIVSCTEFAQRFSAVELRVLTEAMGVVHERVLDRTCQLGIAGPHGRTHGLEQEHLTVVRMVTVASPSHPAAARKGRVPTHVLEREVQIVLSERGSQSADQGVLSARTWRVAELATKHAMLLAGLGWGNMPEPMVRDDLREKRLVRIKPAAWPDVHDLPLSVVRERGQPIGIAARWLLERLKSSAKSA